MSGARARGNLGVRYDAVNDVLYIDGPRKIAAYTFEATDGVFLKVDPWTDELTGAVVSGFVGRDKEALLTYLLPLGIDRCELESVFERLAH